MSKRLTREQVLAAARQLDPRGVGFGPDGTHVVRDPQAPITLVMRPELAAALVEFLERAVLELEMSGQEARAAFFVIAHVRTGEPRP